MMLDANISLFWLALTGNLMLIYGQSDYSAQAPLEGGCTVAIAQS